MVRLLLALGLLALSGCTGPSTLAVADADAVPDSTPNVVVLRSTSLDMVLEQGATADIPSLGHAWLEAGSSGRLSLEISPHAKALLLELVVHDGDGTLLLHATPPSVHDQTPILADASTLYARQGDDGTARLVIGGPEPGTWSVDAHADGTAQRMRFTVYATAFSGPVPPGYSAIVR